MRLSRLWSVITSVIILGLSLTSGCQPDDETGVEHIRIATGNAAAVYHVYGEAYAKAIRRKTPGMRPTVLTTAASKQNIEMVRDGTAEVAFSQADVAAAAQSEEFAALARLYDDHLHLVVPASSALHQLTDLREHRVSIGEIDSGTSITVERLFAIASIIPERDLAARRLDLDESVREFRAGNIDAFFFSGGLPVAPITELARSTSIRLIDLSDYIAPMRKAFHGFYSERVIPHSAYGLKPITSIGVANYLVVSTRMSDQTAYSLTKTLLTSRDELAAAHPTGARLNPRVAIGTKPLPLHPGAARYYRDVKT
jgi:TRAP transporter TAXI family solute receptor